MMNDKKAVVLPMEDAAFAMLEERHGYRRNSLPAGYFGSLAKELPALDFSDFAVLVRDDLPDDIAYLLTWCLVERRETIERQYRHLPPDRSPLSYPLEPRRMAQTPIPLHPAAERYYRAAGLL